MNPRHLIGLVIPFALALGCTSDDGDGDPTIEGCSATCDRRVELCADDKAECVSRCDSNREGKSAESIAAVERCVEDIQACEEWRGCVQLLEDAPDMAAPDMSVEDVDGRVIDVPACVPEGGPWLCCRCEWTGCNSASATVSRLEGPDGPARPLDDCCEICAEGPGPFDRGCVVVTATGSDDCE